MFTLLNLILTIVLLIQVVKCRQDINSIDCPAAKEVKELRNKIRSK